MMNKAETRKAETAKYLEFARKIRARIEAGALEPGERLPSYQAVRERYGLSQATVEKAYGLLEEEGWVERRPSSGTYVADAKQNIPTGVVAVVNNLSYDHDNYMRLLRGVRAAAYQREVELLLLHLTSRVSWEKVDGVLSSDPNQAVLLYRMPPAMPHISMLHEVDRAPCVQTNDYEIMRETVRYLISLGHERIAYLSTGLVDDSLPVTRRRVSAYFDELHDSGITFRKGWGQPRSFPKQPVADERRHGYVKMKEWLHKDWDALGCSAILAHNDDTAMGILDALQEAGRKVPEDVSVIGFDGLEYYHPWCGRVSSAQVPLFEIGQKATGMLIDWIKRPVSRGGLAQRPDSIEIPSRLFLGDSVGPPKKCARK